jgi:hypothetical protein
LRLSRFWAHPRLRTRRPLLQAPAHIVVPDDGQQAAILGSIAPGKLADLVVLDRDYLTIPADQIKDIKPVLTMVGGKVTRDAAALR